MTMDDARWYHCRHCGFGVATVASSSLTCPVCAVLTAHSYADGRGDNDRLRDGAMAARGLTPERWRAFYPIAETRTDHAAMALAARVADAQVDARWPKSSADRRLACDVSNALDCYADEVGKLAGARP